MLNENRKLFYQLFGGNLYYICDKTIFPVLDTIFVSIFVELIWVIIQFLAINILHIFSDFC